MASINTILKLQDKMSAQLDRIESAANKTNNTFQKVSISVDNVDKKMQSSEKASSSLFSTLVKFELLKSVFSSLFNLIGSQLNNAISRFDTLNNYVKVMNNLGISEEAANASRERLAEGLKGIPTTLDSAALAVQRFTSSNGDVEASTEMFLALNNAILAGGASTQLQTSALEQMAQAYAKGKPDMMEWRTLQQAMPGQLKQIAKAMNTTTTQLGEDLRKGKVSMNEFMKTVVELNQEGIDGFDNFRKQAENATGGIQTAIANMQSAISRGWTKMISGANTALEASGLPTIQQIITNLGNGIEEMMTRIGNELIPSLGQSLATLGDQFNAFSQSASNSATSSLGVWDYFMIGFNAIELGILTGLGYLQLGLVALKIGFQTVVTGILGVWQGLATGIQMITLGVISLLELLVNNFLDGVNAMIDVVNIIPGINIGQAEKVTWSADYADKVNQDMNDRQRYITDMVGNIDDSVSEVDRINEKLTQWQAKAGQNFLSDFSKRQTQATTTKATTIASTYDPNNISNLLNGVIDSDGTGGKAIKTTTDDNLLSDEDIQLLLDVATRDYKLNYQQVTPQITLTFGDIRETVDVEDVLDKVADKLEEIYDSDLEVAYD